MLTHIDVNGDDLFTFKIVGATPKDSLLIRKVTGLGPPDVNLFIGDYSRDGGIYSGRRVGVRNPVFTIEINPNPALGETVSSLRQVLYKAFLDPLTFADYLKLNLHFDDGRSLFLVGYTEKFETDIFSVDNLAQISMICPDPFIRDDVETKLESTSGWTILPFEYRGTAETGFAVDIDVVEDTSVLHLLDFASNNVMQLEYDFLAGDKIELSTVRGERRIDLYRLPDTEPRSILQALTPGSPWLELHSLNSKLLIYGLAQDQLVATIGKLSFRPAYWGI